MKIPFIYFTKKDWILWSISMIVVLGANIMSPEFDMVVMIAALIGVTSLIFAAKGNVWSQILIIVFSILYGIISFRFRYWGEMVTYLGMTLPMAVWSTVTWIKNPSETEGEVKISTITRQKWVLLLVLTIVVTCLFYFILRFFNTPNLAVSTLSVTTSFLAASLTILRSPYFALCYAMNDLVLIVLWILATMKNPVYFPVIINFAIFFINDIYGFVNWRKRESSDKKAHHEE
ncbi:MAG: nicotinamide riboside transporter PnuC [Lachnospiraceae bacterium]|nr:nicotinamide riboside transporter PnuC [Lachnospiraceae bacterium]